MQTKIDLIPLTGNLISQVVGIHSQAFANEMSAKLGQKYLIHFFQWFINFQSNLSIAAIENGQSLRGYVIGAPLGYERNLNRDLFWVVAESVLLRPSLWLNKKIRHVLITRARILAGSKNQTLQTPEILSPSASLVAIGVDPRFQGWGIGFQLMQSFEEKAIALRMRSMRLSVYPENVGARHLYEKCGWSAHICDLLPNQTMYYYKIIAEKPVS